MRSSERRKRKAALYKLPHGWKCCQIELDILCTDHMACDADVRKARIRAERERRRRADPQKPFVGAKPLDRPMLTPLLDRVSVCAECLREVIANPRCQQRVGVRDRHQ